MLKEFESVFEVLMKEEGFGLVYMRIAIKPVKGNTPNVIPRARASTCLSQNNTSNSSSYVTALYRVYNHP